MHLKDYTDNLLEINQAVQSGLKIIFKSGHVYKKAGITLLDIIPKHHYAPDLFVNSDQRVKNQKLLDTLIKINSNDGKDRIVLAPLIHHQPRCWEMNQLYKSPSYLTKWKDLLRVN